MSLRSGDGKPGGAGVPSSSGANLPAGWWPGSCGYGWQEYLSCKHQLRIHYCHGSQALFLLGPQEHIGERPGRQYQPGRTETGRCRPGGVGKREHTTIKPPKWFVVWWSSINLTGCSITWLIQTHRRAHAAVLLRAFTETKEKEQNPGFPSSSGQTFLLDDNQVLAAMGGRNTNPAKCISGSTTVKVSRHCFCRCLQKLIGNKLRLLFLPRPLGNLCKKTSG